jgi:hypothetical protein
MKRIVTSIILVIAINSISYAQKKASFSSQTYVGIINGEANTELQLQTINGLKWNKWFGGIGTGIDWYFKRSIPLFASVNRSLWQKGKRSFMLSGDAGINFPWEQQRYYYWDLYGNSKQTPGLYWATGLGYKFGVGKADNAILMQFGYNYKKLGEKVTSVYPCLVAPCPEVTEKYDYRLKRLSFKLGWGF